MPYTEVVLQRAQQYGLDPRFLYAMLRQESLFDPNANSPAGAYGLAQIMPVTGRGIAQGMKLEGFQDDDLFHPVTSIWFGAFYLAHQIKMMEGSLPGGLAAYNGGPGNAQRWANGTTVTDQDLFVEGIDYSETRTYVKLVYAYYREYQLLYRIP